MSLGTGGVGVMVGFAQLLRNRGRFIGDGGDGFLRLHQFGLFVCQQLRVVFRRLYSGFANGLVLCMSFVKVARSRPEFVELIVGRVI